MDKNTIKAEIVQAMRAELRRQFDDGALGWYAEFDEYVAVDGNPDLAKLADGILAVLEKPESTDPAGCPITQKPDAGLSRPGHCVRSQSDT